MRNRLSQFRVEFSVRGELITIIVSALDRTDAKRAAWADLHAAIGDTYPHQPVLRSTSIIRPLEPSPCPPSLPPVALPTSSVPPRASKPNSPSATS